MRQCANTECNMRDVQQADGTNCSKHSEHAVDLCEMYVKTDMMKDKVLKIVDACFHAYASNYRNEAREMALRILNT